MSTQLVLAVTAGDKGKTLGDWFRWCWLGADGQSLEQTASGDRAALQAFLGEHQGQPQSTWLILPGERVATRALEYSEKEKKHLRNLLPYQLEDSVIGDVDDLHFALSPAADGQVTLAFTERTWLQAVFAELAALGLEITRCWSAPLTLPLLSDSGSDWTLGWYDEQLIVRYHRFQGFAVKPAHAGQALQMLLSAQERAELPDLHLRAASEEQLASLRAQLPEALQAQVVDEQVTEDWALDFAGAGIDLCQGEFSQRLPIERWWKLWQSVAIFAGVCVLVYLGSLLFEIHRLNGENLHIRQQIETAARQVIPQGRLLDAEKQVSILLHQMEPTQRSGSVMELLAVALPQIAALPNVQVKGIAYSADTGELNINIQADSFSAFQTLSNNIKAQGLNAELLSANVQGSVQSARLKVSKP